MDNPVESRQIKLICIALAVITLAVYWQVWDFDFTNFDDDVYVHNNVAVQAGLRPVTIKWAFTTNYQSNWHPLTWISLMADTEAGKIASWVFDIELGRGNPGVYHLTNVLLHLANTLVVFTVLLRMTGWRWRIAFVAALFALHPAHVESVAWIAERKDVLSTLFWLGTMWFYTGYTRSRAARDYLLALGLFALGLLSKPMLVSLPLVLLLLDYWPLGRLRDGARWQDLVREKAPFLALAFVSCVVTFWAQRTGGAVGSFETYPLGVRLANAIVAYAGYIAQMFWPVRLAVLYPHPGASLPLWKAAGSAAAMIAVTAAAVRAARTRPYFIVGWLWYLITLVPVIGLVQVGKQPMADRYTYVPLLGLFFIISWGGSEVLLGRDRQAVSASLARKAAAGVLAAAVILALIPAAYAQVGVWRDSITLWRHAIAVGADTPLAHNNLATALKDKGFTEDAISEFRTAIQMEPEYADAIFNLATTLGENGQCAEAAVQFRRVLKLSRGLYPEAHNGLGICLRELGDVRGAIRHFRRALELNPDLRTARDNLDQTLALQGSGP